MTLFRHVYLPRAFSARFVVENLFRMRELHRQRRQLRRLSDQALADIGRTRDEARIEGARAPWDAPRHWLK